MKNVVLIQDLRMPGSWQVTCLLWIFSPRRLICPERHLLLLNKCNPVQSNFQLCLWPSNLMYSSVMASVTMTNLVMYTNINTLRPRQNGRRFADDTLKHIFFNENVRISIKISLKFFPQGPINNNPALVQIMAWRRSGDKPLSEPMMVNLLMHICVTRPQWVNMCVLLITIRGLSHYQFFMWNSNFMEIFISYDSNPIYQIASNIYTRHDSITCHGRCEIFRWFLCLNYDEGKMKFPLNLKYNGIQNKSWASWRPCFIHHWWFHSLKTETVYQSPCRKKLSCFTMIFPLVVSSLNNVY